ncbi:MAG: SIS domain-containing protein [Clostridiales bacterium]|nr:SIS domain-containing protein [Clostridiales bacterium]
MKNSTKMIFDELISKYPALNVCKSGIMDAFKLLKKSYEDGGKVLTCGNGGSAADSEHIVGELMKNFKKCRKANQNLLNNLPECEESERLKAVLEGNLPAISLTSHISLTTAYSNDKEPSAVFAQQLAGLGEKGDTLIAISTSGNSLNCVYACLVAKAKGLKTVAMTGQKTSRLSALADVTIAVPEMETYKIQELHLPVYHALCAMLEEEFFD